MSHCLPPSSMVCTPFRADRHCVPVTSSEIISCAKKSSVKFPPQKSRPTSKEQFISWAYQVPVKRMKLFYSQPTIIFSKTPLTKIIDQMATAATLKLSKESNEEMCNSQCDQIRPFLRVFGDNFQSKNSQNIC